MSRSGSNNGRYLHGHCSGGPDLTYRSWVAMIQRCSNPNRSCWRNYGGRGIQVCERWKDFEAFLADMGPRPSSKHSIERINNDGHYEPGNCRWATRAEQLLNRRPMQRPPTPRRDIAGQRFGRLVAQSFVRMNARRASVWLCVCDCGARREVAVDQLTGGNTRSCGCQRTAAARVQGAA